MSSELTSPSVFFDTVNSRVMEQLERDFKELEDDLQQRYKAQKGQKDSAMSSKLRESTERLRDRLKPQYNRNLDKFRVYCLRNVFSPTKIGSMDSNNSKEALLESKANEARERYIKSKEEYDSLAQECRDLEVILKNMRSSMFNLRIGSQVLEDHNVNLTESVANLAQYQSSLIELCNKSQAIVDQLNAAQPIPVSSSNTREVHRLQNQDNSILAGDISDIMMLSENLR